MKCLIWISLGMCCAQVQAAQPDAGSLLQDIKPPAPLKKNQEGVLPKKRDVKGPQIKSDIKVKVTAFEITGAQAIPEAELQAVVAEAIGKELTVTQLAEYAQRITDYYHKAGYALARAYLPPQKIQGGVVKITVLEGKLGKLRVNNQSSLSAEQIKEKLGILKEGHAIDSSQMEKELLLLSDLQGVNVKSTLKPGESVGTTDLDISLEPEKPYSITLFGDNYSSRYTGEWRAGSYVTLGNVLGLSDTLDVRGIASTDMQYGRLAWQLPVNDMGTQAGASFSFMRYELIEDYESLDAHGTATISSLYAVHPFIRSRNANLNAQLAFEHKKLDDNIDAASTQTRKHINLLTLGISGDNQDGLGGGGMSRGSLSLSGGNLSMDADSKDLDDAGYRTSGHFNKLNVSAKRLQYLFGQFNLYVSVQGQLTEKNLDSAEKMTLGGAQGVRAYPQGEASADEGWLGTAELRYAIYGNWQASVFYDKATGKVSHTPLATDTDNSKELAGYGIGLSYTPKDFSLTLTAAWRDGPQPEADKERSPRIWAQGMAKF